ncbi:MAG: pyruvate oxidase [Limosilactobacillus sp.]|uniref:pyruvate oxidase n=1 Tax=Limosilactobacillus sp. TaxID=2773925 RepID=UPI0026FB7EA3|nr:pyruvate oxidase [Limosilactobacillus sp.]
MAKIKAANAMLQVLVDWGIDHVYGYPGGSNDSTMNALHEMKDKIKLIEIRHEEAASLAASSEYKISGKLGVCFGSAGPGAIHLMTGLYDAKYDGTPMVAIVANVPTDKQDMNFFQAFDEQPWFRDVAVWVHQAKTKEALPMLMDDAIRQAYAKKGPAVVVVPKDFGWQEINDNFRVNANCHVGPNYAAPTKESIDQAVKMIKQAKNPVVYFGIGCRGAGKELKEFSDKFKMPLMSSVIAKGIVEDKFPAYLGSIGRCAPKASNDIQSYADLVIWIGNNSPFSNFFFHPNAKVIQVDVDSMKLGKRHSVDLPILADAKKTLQAIIDAGEAREESPLYKAGLEDRENWEEWLDSFKDDHIKDDGRVRSEPIFDVINKYAADDATFAIDVGNTNINFTRLMNLNGKQKWSTSGLFATMGYASPAAIAAAQLNPGKEVWALAGDGAFAMMNQELITMARYNYHILNIVFSNQTLGFIEASQTDVTNQPLSGVIFPGDDDWAKVAEGMNVKGVTVTNKAEFEAAVKEWKKMDGPMLIDVKLTKKMPYSTQLNNLDNKAFVEKYNAQGLKPFSYFAEKYGVVPIHQHKYEQIDVPQHVTHKA